MEIIQSQDIQIPNLLPDFSREIPTGEAAVVLAKQATSNRALLSRRAAEFGLNPNYLNQQTFIVGPFVSPAPLPTTFAGNVNNFADSLLAGYSIVNALNKTGQPAQQNLVVNLAMSEVPRKGIAAMDALIVPKNKVTNQRLFLYGNPERGQIYGNLQLTPNYIAGLEKPIQDSYVIYTERQPQLKRKSTKKVLPEAVFTDITTAFTVSQNESNDANPAYLLFATNLNSIIAKRIIFDQNLPITCIDTTVYSSFFKYGIANIATFTRKLQSLGFFDDNPGFLKIVDENGQSRILELTDIGDNDVKLSFRDLNESLSFRNLQTTGADIAPCKELSYILDFANIVPVIYGSENSGEYYEPYAIAQDRIKRLGFKPTMYRIQSQISDTYEQRGTIFDFYQQLLLPII